MRLRKKKWITEAIQDYAEIVILDVEEIGYNGCWQKLFGNNRPIHLEVGTGKGRFIVETAVANPSINYIGLEKHVDVLYYAAKFAKEKKVPNLRLIVGDASDIDKIFAPGEINQLYINFCDPWPKDRHAKRRLTHENFLAKYKTVLVPGGEIHFKTDNRVLFEFSLSELARSGFCIKNDTFDLHNTSCEDNIMTEYEMKFSQQGMKICRCEAVWTQVFS